MSNNAPKSPWSSCGNIRYVGSNSNPQIYQNLTARLCKFYKPQMSSTDHQNIHRDSYFYTILFLDNYFPEQTFTPNTIPPQDSIIKTWSIKADTSTQNIQWLQGEKLSIKHNMPLPITVTLWDNNNNPIAHCDVLHYGMCNVSLGNITIKDQYTIIIDLCQCQKPKYEQTYKLAIKTVPQFAISGDCCSIQVPYKRGLAIIYRRHSLDSLYDLINQFDQTFYHSTQSSSDMKLLTELTCYKDVYFATKYTNNLQDVIDLIDVNRYVVEYSWEKYKQEQINY